MAKAKTTTDAQAEEAKAQATPPATKDTGDGSTASGPNVAATSEITSNTNPASREPGDTSGPDNLPADASPEQVAIQPVLDASGNSDEVKERARVALANAGETPRPTMVNGVYVGGKVYDEATDTWVDDPDATPDAVRAEDIFDRIGNAFQWERQRMVLEEIVRMILDGQDGTSTQELPEGMPTRKSTASLRTDVSGYGGYAGGGPGPRPIPTGDKGQAQVGELAEADPAAGQPVVTTQTDEQDSGTKS